jgi:hypothetical protein
VIKSTEDQIGGWKYNAWEIKKNAISKLGGRDYEEETDMDGRIL